MQHLAVSERIWARIPPVRERETPQPVEYVEHGRQNATTRSQGALIVKVLVLLVTALPKNRSGAYHLLECERLCDRY